VTLEWQDKIVKCFCMTTKNGAANPLPIFEGVGFLPVQLGCDDVERADEGHCVREAPGFSVPRCCSGRNGV